MEYEKLKRDFHSVPNGCANKSTLNGFGFELKSYTEAVEHFQHMDTAYHIYEGDGSPSKTKHPR